MAVDINDTPNRVRYTATAGQTAFSVPFQFLAATDLKIYQNGVLKTISTHYTVAGAGASSGTVTLVSGAALSDDILIIRDLPVERIGDFPISGPFDVESLNRQLDAQTMMVRDMETRIDRRLLRQPVADLPETLSDIPAKAARANLYLGFDANGQPKTDLPNAAVITDYGTRIGALETISGGLPAVNTIATNIASVTAVSAINTKVVIAADNVADINNFADVYQGGKAADPTLRNDGTALQTGDLYFNTTNDRMRVYETGTGWIDYEATTQAAATTATTQAGIATTQAGTATTQAATATSSASAATSAKIAAEAARDAALVSGRVYATTAAGLAATTNGQYFSVPATATSESLLLYLNSSGTAVFVKAYPSSEAFVFFAPLGYSYAVLDGDGRAAFGVKNDGTVSIDAAEANTYNGTSGAKVAAAGSVVTLENISGYAYTIQDASGRAAFGVKNDGTVAVQHLQTNNLTAVTINDIAISQYLGGGATPTTGPTFLADVNHIFTYGQSLSVGATSTPAVTTFQPYDSLKLNGGVRPHDTGTRTAFAALTETVSGGLGETPSAGTAHAIKQLIASENNLTYLQQSYQLLLSADGDGGQTLAALTNPSGTYYPRLVASMQAGYDLAQAAGKTYNVPAFTWTQGEADYGANTASATYISALETLRTQIQASAVSICGQSSNVRMICYQTATHKVYGRAYPSIALAQLQASKDNPLITLATPTYHLPYSGDQIHLTAAGSKYLGFYYGLAYKRTVIDGGTWKPVQPISQFKQGSIITVRFHVPRGPLVLDTTIVSANTNYGFNLFDAGGTAISISSVTLTGPDTVKIVAASSIPTGAKLQYAFYGANNGGASGPRGNLRDSQGSEIVFDPDGLNYPAHNWCVMFELTF